MLDGPVGVIVIANTLLVRSCVGSQLGRRRIIRTNPALDQNPPPCMVPCPADIFSLSLVLDMLRIFSLPERLAFFIACVDPERGNLRRRASSICECKAA